MNKNAGAGNKGLPRHQTKRAATASGLTLEKKIVTALSLLYFIDLPYEKMS